jgi:glycosyltransferase involved in cell wall biosynthesis
VRIVLLNQFHPPDLAPTGRVLSDLASALAARGHDVRVLCSRGAYEGGRVPDLPAGAGPRVRRLPGFGFHRRGAGRFADHALYLAGALAAGVAGDRPDVVVALTTPAYLGLAARALARLRGAAHVHWVMDVYPDAIAAHGLVRRGGTGWAALEALARWQWRDAAALVALGPRMAERVERFAPARVAVVPLWPDAEVAAGAAGARVRALRAERGWAEDEVVLLCSGNLGRGHRFHEFLDAARRLGPSGPRWAFVGDGPRRPQVEAFARAHPSARVSVLPPVGADDLAASLASGDVHLVGLEPAWDGVMVPSRLQAAFASARPVIFAGPAGSEVAQWILESGGGWAVAPGDVDGVLAAVESARDPRERARRGASARAFAAQRFDRARNCGRLADLVEAAFARGAAID